MPNPTVPYKVLARGYRIAGGRDEPLRATVPYLVAWSDAFAFYNQVLGITTATVQGGFIARTPGHQFPPSPNLYARSAEIEPCGTNGDPITTIFKGLQPGEFFKQARVTVEYETPSYQQQPSDDPSNLNQLDPDNPITYCEQEVEAGGRTVTIDGAGYKFDGGLPVKGSLFRVESEARLVLTFPRIPYLPWKKVKSYIGCVNSVAILGSDVGTLLFEAVRIKATGTSQGIQGQSVQLIFSELERDWNMLPDVDGNYNLVRIKNPPTTFDPSIHRLYRYKDLRELFL